MQRYRKAIGAAGGGHTPEHVQVFDLPGSRRFPSGSVTLLDRRDPRLLRGGAMASAWRFIHNLTDAYGGSIWIPCAFALLAASLLIAQDRGGAGTLDFDTPDFHLKLFKASQT